MPLFRRYLFNAIAFMCLLAAPELSAASFAELFRAASATDSDYSMCKIDLELAGLKKSKSDIEAKVELDRLNAESTYVAAIATYNKSVLSFHDEVVDAVYAAASAELDATSARLKLENAKEDEKYAGLLYKSGSSSEVDLKEAVISRKTAENDLELADWNYQVAKEDFAALLGTEWKAELLPAIGAFEPKGDQELWLSGDTTLRKARLTERINALKTAALASNAPNYDRRIQETENAKAKAAVASAEIDGRQAYGTAIRNLKSQAAIVQIRAEELDLKSVALEDGSKQYDGGLISLSDLNLLKIAEISARKNLLSAQKTYAKTVGSFASAMGSDPLGL